MINVPSRIAITGLVGIPRVNRGTKAPPEAELLADSGPANPAIIPVPNFSGVLEHRLSIAYEAKEASVALPPGRTPMKKPMKDPLMMGHLDSIQSWSVGNRCVNFFVGLLF
jgi:hypothetical protein